MKKAFFLTAFVWALVLGPIIFLGSLPHLARAAGTSAVEGYAWSSAFGWVSFNCSNSNSCSRVNYGVSYDKQTGNLAGYAWSSNIGWISFQESSGCPAGPCQAKVVGNNLTGWAKVLSGKPSEGWEGWIHLTGSNYGVTFDGTKFSGYAWSFENSPTASGYWFKFNPSKGPGVFTIADADVTTGVLSGATNSAVLVQTDTCKSIACIFSYEAGKVIDFLATPAPGYYFQSWTGADANLCSNPTSKFCYDITLDSNKEIKAQFRSASCPGDGPAGCPVCNDNEDNDGDGPKDYPLDPECTSPTANTESGTAVNACNDCIDNDGDGLIDWLPETGDPGCSGDRNDNNETDALLTVTVETDKPGTKGKVISNPSAIDCGVDCTNLYTSDEVVTLTALPENPNSAFDHWGGSCTGTSATCTLGMTISRSAIAYFVKANAKDEDPPVVGDGMNCPGDGPGFCPQCSDGIDNDGDGPPDFEGGDEQCVSPEDDSEGAGPNCPTAGPGVCPQCYDGEDNADPEDKIKDYPNDPGCFNRADNNETDPIATGNCPKDGPGLCPACNDGIDNEGDGYVDWSGWDSDKDGINDILRDPSCQGEPDKNSESGAFEEIEK